MSQASFETAPVPPEKVPFIGTTWAHRGSSYWLRRAGLFICWMLIELIPAGMTYALWNTYNHSIKSSMLREGALAGTCLILATSLVWGWRAGRRRLALVLSPSEARSRRSVSQRRVLTLSLVGRLLLLLTFPVSFPLAAGYHLGYVLALTFTRDFMNEEGARLDYVRRMREAEMNAARATEEESKIPMNRAARRRTR